MKKITLWALSSLLILMTNTVAAQNIWTQHNDQGRTGWYPYETTLNTTNVNKNTFGLSFTHSTDDKIYAQPLVVLKLNIPNVGVKNVVFVATMSNTIYAFDADVNTDAYWTKNYTNKISASGPDCTNCRPAINSDMHPSLCDGGYGDFSGNIGIVGTPVIDTAAGIMYFVTKIANLTEGAVDNHAWHNNVHNDEYTYPSTPFHQYLHAIDIATGAERPNSPVEITATVNGAGDGNVAGHITFDPRRQFARCGLVLSNGILYVTFAAHCDFNPSHGWVFSYNASSLALLHTFIATPNDGRGGSWMSGSAPAVDAGGNLYLTTGNSLNETNSSNEYNTYSASPSDPANRGESVIKLAPDLSLADFFTPFTYLALNDADKDFGTQVMLLPNTNLAMTACKDDSLYIMDQSSLGGFNPLNNNAVKQRVFVNNGGGATMHSSFSFFGGPTPFAYQFSENTQLTAYPVTPNGLGTRIPNTAIVGSDGFSGGYLAVSSNGADPATGVLWAYHAQHGCNANGGDCHGILHALNASDITKELWNSDQIAADNVNVFNKMVCPSVALGKVYIPGNSNQLMVFGLKTNTSCIINVALNKPAMASSSQDNTVLPAKAVDGDMGSRWSSNAADNEWFYVDLGARYDICKIAITWETALGKDFDLQVSDDHITWTTIDPVRGNTSKNNEFSESGTGRYVKMQGITRGSGFGYSMYEFQVYGNPASSCPSPTSINAASVTTSSEQLSWDAVSGATQYLIKYRPNLSSSWITRTSNTNSITISALSCGSLYYDSVQAVCSLDNSKATAGSFITASCPTNSCDILPTRFHNVDLGDIGIAGSVCKQGTVYTLSGSSSLNAATDGLQYVYTGNGIGDYDASGLITAQDNISPSGKVGVLIRDSLSDTSPFAYIASVGGGGNFVFNYRNVSGGTINETVLPSHALPYWVKLGKVGTQYSAYTSADGLNWTRVAGPIDLNFGTDPTNAPNYGMAVTSGDASKLTTGSIDNFNVDASEALPIRLLSFTAKAVNHDHVLVSWSTAMEQNVDHFEIQRSADSRSFQVIGKVKAVGDSETTQYYSLNDDQPITGTNYYRLNEIDRDGKAIISPIVSVQFEQPGGPDIYPNPAAAFTNIVSQNEPIVEVTVYDVTGKSVKKIHYAGGQASVKLNTASLAQGIYIVAVQTTTKLYRQKLSKQ